jgi:tetratricopeptide (TPR) repeat protein/predicted aspartyl protease
MNRLARAALAMLSALIFAGHAAAACKIGKIADLPVTMIGTRPMISTKINGADALFVADSGAFYSTLTPASAARFGLALSPEPLHLVVSGIGGQAGMMITFVKKFEIAGATVPNVEFLVGGGEVGNEAAGVLGQNVLGLGDVEYDLANGAIRLLRPHGCGSQPLAYWAVGKSIAEMEIWDANPGSRHTSGGASVNGVKIRVTFDTGASTSMLSLAAARRVGIDPKGEAMIPAGRSIGLGRRTAATWITPVDNFEIGGERIEHTRLRVVDTDLPDSDMLIGADFFLSHRIYVSNSQRKLYFTYNGGPVFNLAVAPQMPQDQTSAAQGPAKPEAGAGEPADAEGFSRQGAALAARRDFEGAIADFTHAIDMAPNEPRYFQQRGLARLGAKQPFLAMADFDQALKLKPDFAPALMARAQMRLAGHDKAEAMADLDAASRLLPRQADGRLALAELYFNAEALSPAIAELDVWIKVHPDDARRGTALAGRCRAKGMLGQDLDKALADCDEALKADHKSAVALDSRGLVRLRMGDYDKAIADYDAALALRPKAAWSLYGRGLAKLRKGLAAQGAADIAAATALQPLVPAQAKARGLTP